ncbi:MAG: hypothetical protein ACYSWU_18270 [Planctomycetota bacterium]
MRFSNILAEGESGILVHGDQSSRIRNLSFENIRLNLKDGPLQGAYGGNFDLRAAKDVAKTVFAHDIPGLYCRYVDGLRIKGLHVAWDEKMPAFFNHALQLEDVANVIIDGFEGKQPHKAGETILLDRVDGVSIRAGKATNGTDVFIACKDVKDARLFTNNDMRNARTVFQSPVNRFTMTGNLLPEELHERR